MNLTLKVASAAAMYLSASVATASATTYTYKVFDVPGASSTLAFGVNDGGQIVGGASSTGFVKTNAKYATLSVSGSKLTQPHGTCDIGRVTGFYEDANGGFHGFIETMGSYTTLDAPNASLTFGFGINLMGDVVGAYYTSSGSAMGYKYSQGRYTTINVTQSSPNGSGVQAHGINSKDQIVGFYGQGIDPVTGRNRVAGFLQSNGAITTFQYPGAYATEAEGINDNGDIVGTYGTLSGGAGFVLSHGVYSTVSVPGVSLTEAQSINNHGEVVGFVIAGGKIHAFTATPVK